MLRTWLLLIAAWLAVAPASAQHPGGSPYELRWGPALAVTGVGAATFAIGRRASARIELMRAGELELLSRDDVLPFDRYATYRASPLAKRISDYVGYGSALLPLSLLASPRARDHFGQIALLYGQVVVLDNGVTSLIKNTVRRRRPYVYNDAYPLAKRLGRDAHRSFFSGHTSNTAANSFFTARVYADFHPDASARALVWTGSALLPAVTGLTRVLSGNHYWTDVLVGYVVGAGIGLLAPRLHLQQVED